MPVKSISFNRIVGEQDFQDIVRYTIEFRKPTLQYRDPSDFPRVCKSIVPDVERADNTQKG